MKYHESRILFLKEFTRELILNTNPIEIEQETPETFLPEQQFEKIMRVQVPSINTQLKPIGFEQTPPIFLTNNSQMMAGARTIEIGESIRVPQELPTQQFRQMTPRQFIPQNINPNQPTFNPPQAPQIQPQITSMPQGFDLGKLNFLIADSRVTIIECPGPDKLVVVRTYGRPNVTKLSLSEAEIKNILETFSKEAKIPIISGLFKAAVGNLIITAIISDIVGSRFVITKITPAFVVEELNKGF